MILRSALNKVLEAWTFQGVAKAWKQFNVALQEGENLFAS